MRSTSPIMGARYAKSQIAGDNFCRLKAFRHLPLLTAFIRALKPLNLSINLILSGSDCLVANLWDYHVLHHYLQPVADHFSSSAKTPLIDMQSIPIYNITNKHVFNALTPFYAEKDIQTTSAFIDVALIAKVPSH